MKRCDLFVAEFGIEMRAEVAGGKYAERNS